MAVWRSRFVIAPVAMCLIALASSIKQTPANHCEAQWKACFEDGIALQKTFSPRSPEDIDLQHNDWDSPETVSELLAQIRKFAASWDKYPEDLDCEYRWVHERTNLCLAMYDNCFDKIEIARASANIDSQNDYIDRLRIDTFD